jgi:hypothetical protein
MTRFYFKVFVVTLGLLIIVALNGVQKKVEIFTEKVEQFKSLRVKK